MRAPNEPLLGTPFLQSCPYAVTLEDLHSFMRVWCIINVAHKVAGAPLGWAPDRNTIESVFAVTPEESENLAQAVMKLMGRPPIHLNPEQQ